MFEDQDIKPHIFLQMGLNMNTKYDSQRRSHAKPCTSLGFPSATELPTLVGHKSIDNYHFCSMSIICSNLLITALFGF